MRVVPNSHFWDNLNTFINYLNYLQMSGNQFYENAFGAEIEYMIIGLENTIKHGYKFKRFAESELDFTQYNEYTIFTSIENIIEHLKEMGREPKDFNTFKSTIENTINSGLNITNGKKFKDKMFTNVMMVKEIIKTKNGVHKEHQMILRMKKNQLLNGLSYKIPFSRSKREGLLSQDRRSTLEIAK